MKSTVLDHSLPQNIERPNNQLIWAIITIFFFLPLGLIAILKALKVNKLWKKGLYDEARQTAFFVRLMTIIGLTVGSVTYLSLVFVLGSIYFLGS